MDFKIFIKPQKLYIKLGFTNTVLKKKNKVGGLILPYFKAHCEDTVIKTVVLVKEYTNRSIEQNRE